MALNDKLYETMRVFVLFFVVSTVATKRLLGWTRLAILNYKASKTLNIDLVYLSNILYKVTKKHFYLSNILYIYLFLHMLFWL